MSAHENATFFNSKFSHGRENCQLIVGSTWERWNSFLLPAIFLLYTCSLKQMKSTHGIITRNNTKREWYERGFCIGQLIKLKGSHVSRENTGESGLNRESLYFIRLETRICRAIMITDCTPGYSGPWEKIEIEFCGGARAHYHVYRMRLKSVIFKRLVESVTGTSRASDRYSASIKRSIG